jgi:hypothetical protein
MSLMRLLTVSRSFTTGVESGRYKMAGKGALPLFEASRRFRQLPPRADLASTEVQSPPAESEVLETLSDREPQPATPLPTSCGEPVVDPVQAPLCEQTAEVPTQQPASDAGVLTAVKDWFQGRKNDLPKSAPAKLPRPRSPMQQALLSLDEVHVVRNDLADADYEVLPARQSWAEVGNPTRSGQGWVGMAWGEAAARWFHSERARV